MRMSHKRGGAPVTGAAPPARSGDGHSCPSRPAKIQPAGTRPAMNAVLTRLNER